MGGDKKSGDRSSTYREQAEAKTEAADSRESKTEGGKLERNEELPSQEEEDTNPGNPRNLPATGTNDNNVTEEDMFQALVEEMTASQTSGQVEVWRATLQELFALAYNAIPTAREVIPVTRQRFPRLTGEEVTGFCRLFDQVFVKGKGTFQEWKRLATNITKELMTTKWAFVETIRKLNSQYKWSQAPVLNQWTEILTQKTGNQNGQSGETSKQTFEDFMFNPAKYSSEEIVRLKGLCGTAGQAGGRYQVREGTEDEWKIIAGLVEGNVACRRLPAFVKQVLKSEERLRLHSTIQAQVEGELVLQLDRHRSVKTSRQSTKTITETILESAELARINLQELHLMLGQTKTISYDQVTKSIHFYFFTRETANRHKAVQVPFRGGIYRLRNAHQPGKGSIWQRQQGANGTLYGKRAEYTVQLHNLTRFNDIGRLAAFLKDKITIDFELEDMDTNTPDSRTSTIWSLTFKLAGCPTFLDGIVRYYGLARQLS